MKTYWIEYKTAVINDEEDSGHWLNVYHADSEQEAIDMFNADCMAYRIDHPEIIEITESI